MELSLTLTHMSGYVHIHKKLLNEIFEGRIRCFAHHCGHDCMARAYHSIKDMSWVNQQTTHLNPPEFKQLWYSLYMQYRVLNMTKLRGGKVDQKTTHISLDRHCYKLMEIFLHIKAKTGCRSRFLWSGGEWFSLRFLHFHIPLNHRHPEGISLSLFNQSAFH